MIFLIKTKRLKNNLLVACFTMLSLTVGLHLLESSASIEDNNSAYLEDTRLGKKNSIEANLQKGMKSGCSKWFPTFYSLISRSDPVVIF